MASPVSVVNVALAQIGQQISVASFSDQTTAARAASTLYTPTIQMLMRAANWDFLRKQIALTEYKAAIVNGQVSANPPVTPWLFEYLSPPDMLKGRFLLPTPRTNPGGIPLTTAGGVMLAPINPPVSIPFVIATDTDPQNNPIKVIYTNLCQAQFVYTADLSQIPDLWDPLFFMAATATLGAYFIQALLSKKSQLDSQIGMAKALVEQARAANGNESISNADHVPDWFRARSAGAIGWGFNNGPSGVGGGFDFCELPNGLFF